MKNWRPDPEGERLGKEVFGDKYEAELADHIDYCLKTDFRCHDHDANWRRRCRALQRNPQLRLDLRPRGPQLGVKEGRRESRKQPRKTMLDVFTELAAQRQQEMPMRDVTPASPESKARVQASLERYLRGESKEASG